MKKLDKRLVSKEVLEKKNVNLSFQFWERNLKRDEVGVRVKGPKTKRMEESCQVEVLPVLKGLNCRRERNLNNRPKLRSLMAKSCLPQINRGTVIFRISGNSFVRICGSRTPTLFFYFASTQY